MKLADVKLRVGEAITAELLEWVDNVRAILNRGKYSKSVTGAIPTATGNDGDGLIYTDGSSIRRLYHYFDSAWRWQYAIGPRRIRQDGQPAGGIGATQIDAGELLLWTDSNDGDRVYLVYNDATSGVVKVELT